MGVGKWGHCYRVDSRFQGLPGKYYWKSYKLPLSDFPSQGRPTAPEKVKERSEWMATQARTGSVLQSCSDFSREAAMLKGKGGSPRKLLAHSSQGLTAPEHLCSLGGESFPI